MPPLMEVPADGHSNFTGRRRWGAGGRKSGEPVEAAIQSTSSAACNGKRVCVIGAGVAALTAARRLRNHGFQVRVFGYCGKNEDGTGNKLGGRLYTEEWDLRAHRMQGPWKIQTQPPDAKSTVTFDAACQYFTASDSMFIEEVSGWQRAGCVDEWHGAKFGALGSDGVMRCLAPGDMPSIFCGSAGMKGVIDFLMKELGEETFSFHIAQRLVQGTHRRYRLQYEEILKAGSYLDFVGGNLPQETSTQITTEEFDYVALAHGLATNQPRMVSFEDDGAQKMMTYLKRNVRFQNILTLTMVFDTVLPLEADVFTVEGGSEIALVVHTSSKPGMASASGRDVWTVFSSPEFASANALPKQKSHALQKIKDAFLSLLRSLGCHGKLQSYDGTPFGLLWPHGRCTTCPAAPARALFSPDHGVGVCADYCAGAPCVEAAVLSAMALADAIAAHDSGSALPPSTLTNFTLHWEPIAHTIPWVVAHFPGLPPPPQTRSPAPTQVSDYCCPTHDGLGSHPGLIFGRSAALHPDAKPAMGKREAAGRACAECRRRCELFLDESDRKSYCAPCWRKYYGSLPC